MIRESCEIILARIKPSYPNTGLWHSPLKMVASLVEKIEEENDLKDSSLLIKWNPVEFQELKNEFDTIVSAVKKQKGNPDKKYYQLRAIEDKLKKMREESIYLEDKSIERDMLVETVSESLTSPELAFYVDIYYEDSTNLKSQIMVKARRAGGHEITMSFDLEDSEKNIETYMAGGSGVETGDGCDLTTSHIGSLLAYEHGLTTHTYHDGRLISKYHPGNSAKRRRTDSGMTQ